MAIEAVVKNERIVILLFRSVKNLQASLERWTYELTSSVITRFYKYAWIDDKGVGSRRLYLSMKKCEFWHSKIENFSSHQQLPF